MKNTKQPNPRRQNGLFRGALKKLNMLLSMSIVSVVCLFANVSRADSIKPVNLRCEYLTNPQGIDIAKPRFAWMCESTSPRLRSGQAKQRGWKQTAYQILVASSPEKLAKDVGDLWDSGKVKSDRSTQVVYGGTPLASRMSCFWKVKVWSNDKNESLWSEAAHWTMGLLKPGDWTAKWISMKEKEVKEGPKSLTFDGAQWIWFPGDNTAVGTRYFAKHFSIPENTTISSARMIIQVDDSSKVLVNGKLVGKTYSWQSPANIDVGRFIRPGNNTIKIEAGNTDGPAGLLCKLVVISDQGKEVKVVSDGTWKASENKSKVISNWDRVKLLGAYGCKPWGQIAKVPGDHSRECRDSPMLRKVFKVAGQVKRAQVSICGLGYYELFLNGSKVGDHVLDPTWTTYNKHVLYVTYDVAGSLEPGRNAFGVQLANGVYNQSHPDAWRFHEAPWKAFPQLLLQMDIEYEDGTKEQIVSDGSWKVSAGPIYRDQLRMGVMYDARREQIGWNRANFDDSSWQSAIIREGPVGTLAAQVSEPAKVMKTLEPVSIQKTNEGYEFDFGQNITGWSRLKVKGKAGTKVTMEHVVHDARNNMGKHVYAKPFQTDAYTLKGNGLEVWEPGFTYHGFRKVKVAGLPEPVSKEMLNARVVYTAFEDRGAFECSNPLLNRLTDMTLWSYIGNFVGMPTDCPHREKNGWTGDANLACELGLMYYGSEAAYTRWLLDIQAAQKEDGRIPSIIPTGGWGVNGSGPSWEIAYTLIPWHMYEYRGDRRILQVHYENQKQWLDSYQKRGKSREGIINKGCGDWMSIKTSTEKAVTETGNYYTAANRMARIAGILGKDADANRFAALAEDIKQAYNQKFYHSDTGIYANGSQTAMSCALYHGLVEPANRSRVAGNLAESIRQNNFTLDVGTLGSKYILRALSDNGYTDIAYKIVIKDDTPGWGKMVKSGNTTLWEHFNCVASDNHVFLGDVTAWFITYLAGIRHDPDNPGFQRFLIKPEVIDDLQWVKAHHDSPYGRIKSAWKKEGGKLSLNVTVPANSTAEVHIPANNCGDVRESGKPAASARGMRFLRMAGGRAVYEVGSGVYHFTSSSVQEQ
jgi:alpha-L-rhamnosidase